jgi:uncharacterized membrane protein
MCFFSFLLSFSNFFFKKKKSQTSSMDLICLLLQHIPGWWIWFYYMCPVAWTLRGIITSQLGDVETKMVGAGFDGSVKEYLEVSLGYSPGMVGVSAAVLIGFCLFFFSIFAISLKVLNFQRR